MPVTNVIVNGSFDAGSAGWSGNDLETSYTESSYLGSNSTDPNNRVAEMDGVTGQITVMQQTFHIDRVGMFPLSFRGALRTAVDGSATEGFRVEILDSANNVIFTQNILPGVASWKAYKFDINFPAAGNYTIRFTELGPNNSLGAIVDDIALLVCFTTGTMIATPTGPRAVETLVPGDLVLNHDGEERSLQWAGSRTVSAAEQSSDASLRPVIFEPGSLGQGLPERRLAVSPQHRMLVSGWKAELWFAQSEVLVPAISLVNGKNIRQAGPDCDVTYVHLLFDAHEIVLAEGCPSESFQPGDHSLRGLDAAARREVLKLFPNLPENPVIAAREVVRCRLASVLSA